MGQGAWGIKSYSVSDWKYTKSRYWTRLMAYSSITSPPIATSRVMGGSNDLVNQSVDN